MLQTNNHLFPIGLLLVTACSILSGCIDNNYDLSDIDTTSRFTVKDLTVPVRLSEIRLDKVIKLDDNDNISIIDNVYAISKGGDIETSEFDLGHIHVAAPIINPSKLSVNLPELPPLSGIEIPLPEIELPDVALQTYDLELANVDEALENLNDIKTERPIEVEVTLSVPASVISSGNTITFKDIKIQLPWGLMTSAKGYDPKTGLFELKEISVDTDGKAILKVEAHGIELGERGKIEEQRLNISGEIGIKSGYITGIVRDLSLPNPLVVSVDYKVSEFDIASFSGDIDYNMGDIAISPISLDGLPDFLNNPETEIHIANPSIIVNLNNPAGRYGLGGKGVISLTSNFKGDVQESIYSDQFTLAGSNSGLSFGSPAEGKTYVGFKGLGDILVSERAQGLPESISVNIQDIGFVGHVTDFPIGNIGKASGDYTFTAPLGFENSSKIVYETTEGDWGGDDIENIYINTIKLDANCSTDIPLGIKLSVVPIDKDGSEISVTEDSSNFEVPAMAQNHQVKLEIKGTNGTIHGFDGVKFKAVITQDGDNTHPIGPDQFIELTDIKVKVDGYFEKEL